MRQRSLRILMAGLRAAQAAGFAEAFRTAGHVLDRASSGAAVTRAARSTRFDLVLLGHPLPDVGLAETIRAVRGAGAASRGAAVMVIAEPSRLDEAASLVGRGVNRVFPSSEYSEILIGSAFRLLEAGLPQSQRFSERLPVDVLADGHWKAASTGDLSASGMLILTAAELAVGSRFRFRLRLPDVPRAIEGEAKVMRRITLPGSGGEGLGVRFCTFEDDGRRLVGRHVERLRGGRAG